MRISSRGFFMPWISNALLQEIDEQLALGLDVGAHELRQRLQSTFPDALDPHQDLQPSPVPTTTYPWPLDADLED